MGTVNAYRTERESADALVTRYAPLVKRIAHHLLGRLPGSVQLDDLVQAGMIGLLEAARKYDAGKGASFETYAGIRIRGAMLDEMRRGDWAPRSVHRNARQLAAAIRDVEMRKGAAATDHEIAEAMGVTLEEYHAMLRDAAGCRLFSFEDLADEDDEGRSETTPDYAESAPNPFDRLQNESFRARLAEAISALPERERLVLSLYYDDELNLKEIGRVLGVTESRISQIHTQAALRLRSRLAEWKG
jgi:RNA polymerase sigma factor for flagellar operon FliA